MHYAPATLHSKNPTTALVTAIVAGYLELLLALIVGELLGLPVLGFRGLLAFLFLWSWVLPDSSMHLCMTHPQCQHQSVSAHNLI